MPAAIAAAVIIAATISFIVTSDWTARHYLWIPTALGITLTTGMALATLLRRRQPKLWPFVGVGIFLILFFAVTWTSADTEFSLLGSLVVLTFVTLGLSVSLAFGRRRLNRHLVRVMVAAYYILIMFAVGTWISDQDLRPYVTIPVVGAFGACFAAVLFPIIKRIFNELIAQEATYETGQSSSTTGLARRPEAPATWIILALFFVPATTSLLALIVMARDGLGLDQQATDKAPDLVVVLVGVIGATLFGALAWIMGDWARRRADQEPSGSEPLLQPAPVATTLALIAAILLSGAMGWAIIAAYLSGGVPSMPALVFGLIMAPVCGVFVAEDLNSNTTHLQVVRSPSGAARFVSGACGIAVGLSILWLVAVSLWMPDRVQFEWAVVAMLLALIGGTFVVPLLCGFMLASGGPKAYLTANSPYANLLQGRVLYAGLMIITVWLPIVVYNRVEDVTPQTILVVLITSTTVMLPFAGPFLWVLENNEGHLRKEQHRRPRNLEVRAPADPGAQDRLDRLRKQSLGVHIHFQRRMAMLLMGLSIAGIPILLFEKVKGYIAVTEEEISEDGLL